MNENQGKTQHQVEGSAFFFGLSLAGIISIFMWFGIAKLLGWL